MRTLVVLLLATVLGAPFGAAQVPSALDEAAAKALERCRAPGIGIGIVLPGGATLALARGKHGGSPDAALETQHRFLAGSTGKTFFSALALALFAEGRLELDAKISTWLSEMPSFDRLPNGRAITVRHLLGHRSGLDRRRECYGDHRYLLRCL